MKRTILVVDDEFLIVDMLNKALSSDTVEVFGASNSEEALSLMTDHAVDVVITDIMLPGVLGTELFFQVKKIDPFIQVIIITGVPTIELIRQMLEGGANDFIIKPFEVEKLKSIVEDSFARLDRWKDCAKRWIEPEPGKPKKAPDWVREMESKNPDPSLEQSETDEERS